MSESRPPATPPSAATAAVPTSITTPTVAVPTNDTPTTSLQPPSTPSHPSSPSPVSLLHSAATKVMSKRSKFREINELKHTVATLQAKLQAYEWNHMNHDKKEIPDSKNQWDKQEISQLSRDLMMATTAQHEWESKYQSLYATYQVTLQEMTTLKKQIEAGREEADEMRVHVEEAQTHAKQHRKAWEEAKAEKEEMQKQLDASAAEMKTLSNRLTSAQDRIKLLESEGKQWTALQQERDMAQQAVIQLRTQMMTIVNDTGQRQHQLQNQLQATRQFLEEVKCEYEQYVETSKMEYEAYKRNKIAEYEKLKSDYDQLKISHYDSTLELDRQQQDIVHALQHQFEEYRTTAELLFANEAKTLEEKLASQMTKYEHEMRYMIKLKDQHFNAMVTSKDAKIMNLIEGTDFQKVLVKHQMEMEMMKKQHERDIEMAREQVHAEHKKLVTSLRKELQDKTTEIEKYHTQILTWEKKLEATLGMLKKQKKLHQMKEESSEKHAREIQEQLNKSYAQVENLIQVKENLRHRILRLRLQLEGSTDDSINSIIKRLTKETKRLNTDLELTSFNYKTKAEKHDQLVKQNEKTTQRVAHLEHELARRTEELRSLTRTFESFLQKRVKSVTRQSIYDPQIQQTLSTLSQPLRDAISPHRPASADGPTGSQTARSSQRTSRLHGIVKHANMKIPEFMRKAETARGTKYEEVDPNAEWDPEESKELTPQARRLIRKRIRYQKPAKLTEMEQANDLIDLPAIQQLEKGFQALHHFKQVSAHYAADARGMLSKHPNDATPSSARPPSSHPTNDDMSTFDPNHKESPWERITATIQQQLEADDVHADGDGIDPTKRVYSGTNTTSSLPETMSLMASLRQELHATVSDTPMSDVEDKIYDPSQTQYLSHSTFDPTVHPLTRTQLAATNVFSSQSQSQPSSRSTSRDHTTLRRQQLEAT